MAHSFTNLLYHIVFTTKGREPYLNAKVRTRLLPHLVKLIRQEDCEPVVVNAMPDHVHLLIKVKPVRPLAEVIRSLKAQSSRWIARSFPALVAFRWQVGYAAFTVSQSQAERAHQYVLKQEQHHRRRTYTDELVALLQAHQTPFLEAELEE